VPGKNWARAACPVLLISVSESGEFDGRTAWVKIFRIGRSQKQTCALKRLCSGSRSASPSYAHRLGESVDAVQHAVARID
jgi:hypothetical protein